MYGIYVAVLALVPVAAQAAAAPAAPQAPTASSTSAAVAPERLALARTAVDAVWPLGTYARMMKGTMDQMMDGMMQSMFDMRLQDMAPASLPGKPGDPDIAKLSLRQLMEKEDPNFQERLRITNRVMMDEMIPVMSRAEPEIREGLAYAYARKFTAEQLSDFNRFFATRSGRIFASESLPTMMDPEVVTRMTRFLPQMIQEMPRIMEKVKQATAHLPPPRRNPQASAGH